MTTLSNARLGTDTALIHDLIKDIERGEVKVPQFQRRFVWKEDQAINLLDSIANRYPVGSILLWRTSLKLATERNIGDFQLPSTDDLSPTSYVLDGQQRLTVIYSCLGAPVAEKGFSAAFDLRDNNFITGPTSNFGPTAFPLRFMFNTTSLLNFRTGLLVMEDAVELQAKLDLLIDAFTNYRIPVVTLKDLTVEEVCPIFERINSSGTRLSTYDLMVAATWSKDFSLDEQTSSIADALKPKGFGDIDEDTVLKCISAIHNKSIKREDVLGLRELKHAKLQEVVAATRSALLKTVDVLATEFSIHSWDFLPYEAIVVVLAYVHAKAGTLNQTHARRVRQWFWRAALGERYRGASEHFVSRDLEAIHEFVIAGKGTPDSFGRPPTAAEIRSASFRSNNSRSRAFILALARRKPRNLTNGMHIDTAEALSIYNQKQFHHIYPQAHLRRLKVQGEINSLANICMLAASENGAISDEDPAIYLPKCMANLGDHAEDVFESNLIPKGTAADYRKLSYPDFLAQRSKLIAAVAADLCGGGV